MKTSRFQWEYRKNASALHKEVGEVLRHSTIFGNYMIYQEYPVCRVNKAYPESSHHFDWVIPDLLLVIESHGEQHYNPVDFSGKSETGGVAELKRTKARDAMKKRAAIEAGWTYIEVSYWDKGKITDQLIYDAYKANKTEDRINEVERSNRVPKTQTDKHNKLLERARDYRKAQYQRAKTIRSKQKSK